MNIFIYFAGTVLLLLCIIILTAYICYRIAFYAPKKEVSAPSGILLPEGKEYEPYHAQMIKWIREARALPQEDFWITSFDGLKLHGKYYEYEPGAPMELMFHGYRGTAERDLSGGVQRCFKLKRNVLVVDQRTSCLSEGHVISFGINESKDCLSWIEFINSHFGSDTRIILTGISMGAATVMTAAGMQLPDNVIGILADCGYTSAEDIIKKTIREMKLPPNLMYPFVKLGARLFGHFDLEERSPIEAMKICQKPVIFIHGEADDFVPCEMSLRNYEACAAPKTILTVPGAGHGLAYLMDNEGYFRTLSKFADQMGLSDFTI